METMWRVLTRKKVLDPVATEQTELARVLNTLDLTALGVGSTLGVGVYVLAGQVAKETAGPAVVLSFLIATVASVFAGLCYAEFGARAPRAGSAYIYSYVCVGEFIAFVIGWNLILEYVIGSASVARGLSLYLDTLINNTLKNTFIDIAPISNVSFMSEYFDFFAFGVSLLLAVALSFGLKESSWVNNIFTLVNLVVVGFVIIAGSTKANSDNWYLGGNSTDPAIGKGGFFPFGVEGMIKGAATCFYGFVGFDCIATTGEEVKNPKRAIPMAIIVSLFVIFLAYFGTSTVVTLMVPYYSQDPNAPLPHAFYSVGMEWAKWVVAIGGIFGLCASLFGAMFPLPRIIYAMASDSIIFRFLGRVSSRFKTPVTGTLLAGLLTGLMAALFELKQLVNMMSIGTLLAYTIVAASVLLLRYEVDKGAGYEPLLRSVSDSEDNETYTENGDFETTSNDAAMFDDEISFSNVLKQIFNCGRRESPSEVSQAIVKIEICIYVVLCVAIGLCVMYLKDNIGNHEIWAIVITAVIVGLTVLVIMSMTTQPKSRKELSFKVPLVPLVPALSILINIYLMMMLDRNTWIRFGVWMLVGLPTYYFSVKTQSDARNKSIESRESVIVANGKLNGYTNQGFIGEDDETIKTQSLKRPAPLPPTIQNIEATIAQLDEILESEEEKINSDRKFSAESMSTASNVMREENVQADVHCSDVKDALPLLQPCDTVFSSPLRLTSIVADPPAFDLGVVEAKNYNTDAEKNEPVVPNEPEPEPLVPENEPVKNETSEPEIEPESVVPADEPIKSENSEPVVPETEPEPTVPANEPIKSESIEPVVPETEPERVVPANEPIKPFVPVVPRYERNKPLVSVVPRYEKNEPLVPVESEPTNETLKPEPEKDTVAIVAPPPPPPPPPLNVEVQTRQKKDYNADSSPRFEVRSSALASVKLKPVKDRRPESAPADDLKKNLPPPDDNLKFGSLQFKEFREKLDQTLQTGHLPEQIVVDLKKKPAVRKDFLANEDVVEDKINRDDAKQKLTAFLERTNSLPYFNRGPLSQPRPQVEKKEVTQAELVEDKAQHRKNMENIFRSVRLRKEDSTKDSPVISNGERIRNDLNGKNEMGEHKQNMDSVFRSIRLRKADSFKNESQ